MSPICVVNITEEDYRTLRLHPAASLVYHGDLDSLPTYFEMIFESPLKGNVGLNNNLSHANRCRRGGWSPFTLGFDLSSM